MCAIVHNLACKNECRNNSVLLCVSWLSDRKMVVQLIGRGGELSQLLERIRQVLPVSKVTTSLNQVVVQQSLLESDIEKTDD